VIQAAVQLDQLHCHFTKVVALLVFFAVLGNKPLVQCRHITPHILQVCLQGCELVHGQLVETRLLLPHRLHVPAGCHIVPGSPEGCDQASQYRGV